MDEAEDFGCEGEIGVGIIISLVMRVMYVLQMERCFVSLVLRF